MENKNIKKVIKKDLLSDKLHKVLANAGVASRREAERMINANRVSVNGKMATIGDRVNLNENPQIRVDGNLINLRHSIESVCRVLAYYKVEGEICSTSDDKERALVFNRLPQIRNGRWINIGRLDVNTSGLLLFTTDGELANRLMHPSHEVIRRYSVRVFGEVTEQKLYNLRKGVKLEDGNASFKSIKFMGGEGRNQWFEVSLAEGRKREVRRLWESQEVQVSRLIRIAYGEVELPKRLPRGGWIELPLTEVNKLRTMVSLPLETRSKLDQVDSKMRIKPGQIRKAVQASNLRSTTAKPIAKADNNAKNSRSTRNNGKDEFFSVDAKTARGYKDKQRNSKKPRSSSRQKNG